MNISTALLQEIIEFLTPLFCFQNENARRALLISSGLRDLLSEVENNVTPGVFVSLAVNHLDQYGEKDGEPALLLLLRGVQEKVGTDKQAELQEFEERLQAERLSNPQRKANRQKRAIKTGLIVLAIILIVIGVIFLYKVSKPRDCWENETQGTICTEKTTGPDMEFVYVPGGEFWMGCDENEQNCDDDEKPRQQVHVNGFWIGKYEVTQAQWEAVMGKNPSNFKGADRPVESVSWKNAQEFLQKLNASVGAGSEPAPTFRLPSEAEWEYAARARTQTVYAFGEAPIGNYAWFYENSHGGTHPVGQKQPNAFGLYDMHGNVWEWVADTYHENYVGMPTDGSAWENDSSVRILRGGGYISKRKDVRSADRYGVDPTSRYYYGGFRVVRIR